MHSICCPSLIILFILLFFIFLLNIFDSILLTSLSLVDSGAAFFLLYFLFPRLELLCSGKEYLDTFVTEL